MNLTYDQTIKVGDIVTTYHKGFWQVIGIDRRYLTQDDLKYRVYTGHKVGDEYNPIFRYKQIATSAFTKTSGKKTNSCDASFCRKVDDKYFAELRQKLEEEIAALEQLRKDFLV